MTNGAKGNETRGITGEPIYKDIIAWYSFLKPRTTADAYASGQYENDYPAWVIEGRCLRKALKESATMNSTKSTHSDIIDK